MKRVFLVMAVCCGLSYVRAAEQATSSLPSKVFTATVVTPIVGFCEMVEFAGERNALTRCFPSLRPTVVNGATVLGLLSAGALVVHDITGASGDAAFVSATVITSYLLGFRKWAMSKK